MNLNITIKAMIKVQIIPPIKPSQVFLGDNFINEVLPIIDPTHYEQISFTTTHS